MCMLIQIHDLNKNIVLVKSFKVFPLIGPLSLLLSVIIYRKLISSNVLYIVDLRCSPSIGYYSLCSSSLIKRLVDNSKEFSQQLLLGLVDVIYIAKPELKYVFPVRIQTKIVVDGRKKN